MLNKKLILLLGAVLAVFATGLLTACRDREIPTDWSATDLPTPAPLQVNTAVTAIDATGFRSSDRDSLVVMEDGSLWSLSGQEGWRRVREAEKEPSRGHAKIMEDVVAVSTGTSHTMVITSDKTLWGWGQNRNGQIGIGTAARLEFGSEPIKIMEDVIAVSAGTDYTMAVTSDNVLWGWGDNSMGTLGDGTTEERHSPVKIMEDVIAVSADFRRTVAITSDNVLWGWGVDIIIFDDGTIADSHSPVRLMDDVTAVSISGSLIAAITSDGTLWNLRTGEHRRIMDDAVAVSVGSGHAVAITSDGALWSWGRNRGDRQGGMLGDGTFRNSSEPVKIMDGVAAVAAGGFHTLAITDDGSLWAWGENTFGQLGIGTYRGEYERISTRTDSVFSTWLSPVLVLEHVPEG